MLWVRLFLIAFCFLVLIILFEIAGIPSDPCTLGSALPLTLTTGALAHTLAVLHSWVGHKFSVTDFADFRAWHTWPLPALLDSFSHLLALGSEQNALPSATESSKNDVCGWN
jgi:hypothetical protein